MPLYEYSCKNCAKINEKLMKISDPHPTECEFCQGGPLVKLVSRTNFVLKGQGWYETDFKNKGASKPADTATPKSKPDTSAKSEAPAAESTASSSKEADS